MTFKQFFLSSVGKKIVMGGTGIFLILFLIVHAGLNATIWANDNGEMFEAGAHFMGGTIIVRILEVGLMLFILLHIIQGIMLEIDNRSKRKVGYAVNYGNRGSTWYSRSMGILGILIFMFLVVHLAHFWVPNRSAQGWLHLDGEIPLFEEMRDVFSNLWIVVLYVISCIVLAFHLLHGFTSAFRSLGVHNKRYLKILNAIGIAYSIIIPLVFALMPISFYFGWV